MSNISCDIIDKNSYLKNKKKIEKMIYEFYKNNGDSYSNLNIEDMVMNKNVFYCIVMDLENVVCLCRFAKMFDRETMYCIRQINTLKQYQHKGYAIQCYDTIQKYLKNKNARKILSFVKKENVNSISLHKKCGYEKIIPNKSTRKTNYYFDGCICFCKKI